MRKVSVVLITRNQEWNVPRLLDSVLSELRLLPETEVLVVDSASTDRTVELARQYPVTVIRLDPGQRLTAAMGRYAGTLHADGDAVLFLDGDMELGAGWLARALQVLDARPDVAVLTGQVIDRPLDAAYVGRLVDPPPVPATISLVPVPYTGGAALYRRSALDEAGGFHPYVYSDEEPDLCIRIRTHGHQIARLDYPIAYHYSRPTEAIATLFARRQRRLYLGAGQNLRYNWGRPWFEPYLRQRGFGLAPAVYAAGGVLALAHALRTRRWLAPAAWLALLGAVLAADALRKRSLYRALFSLILRSMIAEGTVRGIFLAPLDVHTHPVRLEIVQRAGQTALER